MIDNVPNSIGQICALAMTDTARDPRASQCAEVRQKDPASMRAAMEADMAKWGPVVRAAGFKPD
jgi:tripartite-type tricarboxylate transporter receptor subunit TctC